MDFITLFFNCIHQSPPMKKQTTLTGFFITQKTSTDCTEQDIGSSQPDQATSPTKGICIVENKIVLPCENALGITPLHSQGPYVSCSDEAVMQLAPHQPSSILKSRKIGNRDRQFLTSWYKTYPWLDYDQESDRAFCSDCKQAVQLGLLKSSSLTEVAFVETGFASWNKTGRFMLHQQSDVHNRAAFALSHHRKGQSVVTLLQDKHEADNYVARDNLRTIATTVRYLAQQGLALRGHIEEDSNFVQLLKLRASDLPELNKWLLSSKRYIHHDSTLQNSSKIYG